MDTLLLALRVALSLAVVLGLLWLLQRRLARGSAARSAASPITVLGRQRVSPKASVVLVEADGKRFVLGVTDQAITVVHAETASATRVELGPQTAADVFSRSMQTVMDTSAHAALQEAPPNQTPLLRPRRSRPTSPFAGSILSPTTWRQAADAVRAPR